MEDRQDAKVAKGRCEPSELLDELAHEVIGAAIEVHRHLGPGFSELVYEEALALEFRLRGVPFVRQPAVRVRYKGQTVGIGRPDFLVGKCLVVEIKAVAQLVAVHQAQVISYLKALDSQLGLLLNFRQANMRSGIKRVVWSGPLVPSAREQQTHEVYEPHEADHGLVEAGGNTSVALEAVEEELDAIA